MSVKKKKRVGKLEAKRIIALVMVFVLLAATVYMAISGIQDTTHDHDHEEEETTTPVKQPLPQSDTGSSSSSSNARYVMNISVDAEGRSLSVRQTTTYKNDSERTLEGVFFQLYANVYRSAQSAPFADVSAAYPDGYRPAGLYFTSVTVDGEAAEWGIAAADESAMRVGAEIAPGDAATFYFEYELLLPEAAGRLAAGDLAWELTGFYPAAAVFDAALDEFALTGATAVADSIYERASDFYVTLSLPDGYRAASTGEALESEAADGARQYVITAESARYFGIAISRKLEAYEAESASGKLLRCWSNTPSGARAALAAAVAALDYMEEALGEYPYTELELVQSDLAERGQASCGMALIAGRLFELGNRDELSDEVTRQVARQYFECLVGSNPELEPWLSETLPEFMRLLCLRAAEGEDAYLKALNALAIDSLNATIAGSLTPDSGRSRFSARERFEMIVIERGCAALHLLMKAMGDETFAKALALYVKNMSLREASVADFAAALNEASGGAWGAYLMGEFHNISDYTNDRLEWFE